MRDNNGQFATELKKHNKKHDQQRKKKQIKVAKAGFPELLGKLYQIQHQLFGDFDFITNNDYLQLGDKEMFTVAYIPWILWQYNIIWEPFYIAWMFFAGGYILLSVFVMWVKTARYELYEDDDHPMLW